MTFHTSHTWTFSFWRKLIRFTSDHESWDKRWIKTIKNYISGINQINFLWQYFSVCLLRLYLFLKLSLQYSQEKTNWGLSWIFLRWSIRWNLYWDHTISTPSQIGIWYVSLHQSNYFNASSKKSWLNHPHTKDWIFES